MGERFSFNMDHSIPLLCQSCGEPCGRTWGEQPDPALVVARCYQCAATEEAEAILRSEESTEP